MPTAKLDFDKVFTESGPFVWRVLGRLGVAKSDLADVCQEVFLIVYRRLGDYDGRAPVRAWVYGICVRQAVAYRRRAHRRHEAPAELPDAGGPPEQAQDIERSRARERLQAVLRELDEDKRAVFVLYELEELTMKEIATVLACPLQTAYSRLHAARAAVRQRFGDFPDFEAS